MWQRILYFLYIFLLPGIVFSSADLSEENGYLRNLRAIENSILYSDNYASGIYIYRNGQSRLLVTSRGAGYYYSVSPDEKLVAYKVIDDNGRQRPALVDISSGIVTYLGDFSDKYGQPTFFNDNRIAYTRDTKLILSDGREFELGVYSNIAPVSPDGHYVCYNDNNDQLWLLNLDNQNRKMISDKQGGYYYPQWNNNSRYVLFSGFDSKIYIYDLVSDSVKEIAKGHEPRWSQNGKQVIFYRKEIEKFELINCDLYIIQRDGQNLRKITETPDQFEIDPVFLENDQQIMYHNLGSREIIVANLNATKSSVSDRQVVKVSIVNKTELPAGILRPQQLKSESEALDVPYLHQVYDVPDWFWGYYACAPTTAAMLLAYHHILPKWEAHCSSPYSHTSYWGRYICERYYYREQDYKYSSSPNGHTAGKGGYGYMWGTGGSPNSRMADYYKKHGLGATQTWSTSWAQAVNNINNGNPYTMCVWLTGSGHLVLAKGIVGGKKTLIFNDPYGNKNTAGYPSYDGAGACYDWPGYNEGNVNLALAGTGIPWCIATTFSGISQSDSVIDDLDFEKGFYLNNEAPSSMAKWKDKKSGYNGHYWYCDSRQSTETDTCFAEWIPEPPSQGWYSVFVYIPAGENATTKAVYEIHHATGSDTVKINQSNYSDEWVFLGSYIFAPGGKSSIHLGDACGETGKIVLFDAIKFRYEKPVSLDFTANITSGEAPLTVQFSNVSEYLPENCRLLWNFGDGDFSSFPNPEHIYRKAGDYDIRLTVNYPDTVQSVIKNGFIHVDSAFAGDFSLIVPENNSILRTTTPLFYWLPIMLGSNDLKLFQSTSDLTAFPEVAVVGNYQLFINTNSDFGSIVPIEADTNCYRPENPFNENQEYFWQVIYITEPGDTARSAIWSFSIETENSPPGPFTLMHPKEGDVLTDLSPRFEWTPSGDKDVKDSIYYRAKIGEKISDFRPFYEGSDLFACPGDSLIDNRIYYWQVEAIDKSGAVTLASGSPVSFCTNIANDSPRPVILILPKNNDFVYTEYPRFEWSEAIDPDPYDDVNYRLNYWPVGAVVRYVYHTDTTFCDSRKIRLDRDYYWFVEAEDREGLVAVSDTFILKTSSTGIAENVQIPREFALYQNSPNPFNPTTSIRFDIPEQTHVKITIFDLTGRSVRTLLNGEKSAGVYRLIWDGRQDNGNPAAAGVYVYSLQTDRQIFNKKMLLLK